jgi:hypothetical protein
MINKAFDFEFKELNLSASMVETVLGYKEGEDRELVSSLIIELLNESCEISNIKSQYTLFDDIQFDNIAKSIEINKISFQIKKIVFGQIKKSDSVAIFTCTAGEEIGIRSRKAMQERDFLRGYIYDVIGSEIVEAAADLMQADLERTMLNSGSKITNRYSPGYCNWDVAEQHKLFKLIPNNYCGIKLTQSALMDPVKSISGIIGVGKNVKYSRYTCSICGQADCVYRRIRNSETVT